jgi:hypothetical protein
MLLKISPRTHRRARLVVCDDSTLLSSKKSSADGPAPRPDGLRSGLSAVVARTVRARVESVRVPSFSQDLLPKIAGLTRETVGNGSRPPPLYR